MFIWILALHFIGDFICQSHWMASNKASNFKALHAHVSVYSLIMAFGVGVLYIFYPASNPVFDRNTGLDLAGCTCAMLFWTYVSHFATDAVTSRISGKLFAGALGARDSNNGFFGAYMHDFFVIIGLDQFVHVVTLYWTLRLLGFPV